MSRFTTVIVLSALGCSSPCGADPPDDAVFIMKGAAQLFPVGRWSSDHFALFDSLTGGKPGGDQCPGELTADTCAAYLPPGTIIEGGFQSEVPWRELYETRDLPVYVNGTRVGSWNPDDTGRYARYTYPG